MSFVKFASFENAQILEVKGSNEKRTASLDKFSEFDDYRTQNGFLYARIRAISSRTNFNNDGWPSSQLAGGDDIIHQHRSSTSFIVNANKNAKYGFSTFLGRPVFVDHNNSDPQRARGVVVDAKLHVEPYSKTSSDSYYDTAPDYYHPPTWVELLLEIDAKTFPKFAKAIIDGAKDSSKGIDGFSMGANVKWTECSLPWCQKKAYDPEDFCSHVKFAKGADHSGINPKTGNREVWKCWENCFEPGFFELSGVFQPADETALTREVIAGIRKEGSVPSWNSKLKTSVRQGPPYMDLVHQYGIPYPNAPTDLHSQPNLPIDINEEGAMSRPSIHQECQGKGCPGCNWNGETSTQEIDPGSQQGGWDGAATPYNVEQFIPKHVQAPWGQFTPENRRRQGAFDAGMNQGTGICPRCGGRLDPDHGNQCVQCQYQDPMTNINGMGTGTLETPAPAPSMHPYQPVTAAGIDPEPNAMGERFIGMPCPNCYGKGLLENSDNCPNCGGIGTLEGNISNGIRAQPRGEGYDSPQDVMDDLVGPPQGHWPVMEPQRNQPGDMLYQIPKNRPNLSSLSDRVKTADKPQSDLLSVPEHVDTLREMSVCETCGSEMDSEKCKVCGWVRAPDSLDDPDLDKAQERVRDTVPPRDPRMQDIPDPLEQAQTPPPGEISNPNNSNSLALISSMDWTFYHPKLGTGKVAGKINPVERPVLPNGPPATNDPRKETIISSPQGPITSRTAATMIAAVKQKENTMNKTADAASGAPAVATPDTNVGVVEVGGVMDASNEAASQADAQVDVLGIGSTGVTDVGSDHDSMQSASLTSDDSGFNADKTTDDSGPTMVWDLNYSDSAVETQEGPVTREPYPASEEGVKSAALDANPYPEDHGPGLAGGGANSGTQPADPVGNAEDRVDVLDATTTPSNNSGPTKTWSGTGGNEYSRQQEPVTNEPYPAAAEGVKRSSINSHVVNAMKLADLQTEIGLDGATNDNKYERVQELLETDPALVERDLSTLARVKTAGLKRPAGVTRMAGRVPSFNKAAAESSTSAPSLFVPDESLFMR